MDYISINDENSSSQQYHTKTVLEMHRHNCDLQNRHYLFYVFQAKWARSACKGHVALPFANLKKRLFYRLI